MFSKTPLKSILINIGILFIYPIIEGVETLTLTSFRFLFAQLNSF